MLLSREYMWLIHAHYRELDIHLYIFLFPTGDTPNAQLEGTILKDILWVVYNCASFIDDEISYNDASTTDKTWFIDIIKLI